MRNKVLSIVCLVFFCVIIILPPIIHGYVYPNIGDDTAAHMNVLDKVGFFSLESHIPRERILYLALFIIGYPLDLVSYVFNIDNDVLFLWFNFIVLIGVGITLFFVFKNLISIYAGLLALLIPVFTSFSILLLFYSGVIFEIINMCIILPLAFYFGIRWWMTKKKRFAIGGSCLLVLFTVFHSTGIYSIFIIIAGFLFVTIYKIVKKQLKLWQVILGLGVVCSGIALFVFVNPVLRFIFELMEKQKIGLSGFPLLQESLLHYMSYFVLIILVISTVFLIGKYKLLLLTEKLTIGVFGILAVMMLPAIIFGWSPQPFRQGLTLAILLSLVAVALLGVVIRLDKSRLVAFMLVVVVICGAVPHVNNWFGYNSAVEEIDIKAMEYINTLPGEFFYCSSNVDHWVYSRYINKRYYVKGRATILIVRNIPMKSKVALVDDREKISDWTLLKTFIDGDLEIRIYE